jgi:DNA-binding response OmpR family regulator
MEVLIIERDERMGLVLADTLDREGISFAVASDEEALNLPSDDAPRVVITGLNPRPLRGSERARYGFGHAP